MTTKRAKKKAGPHRKKVAAPLRQSPGARKQSSRIKAGQKLLAPNAGMNALTGVAPKPNPEGRKK